MKRLVDTITVNNEELEYFIVRALENTDHENGDPKYEVEIDDRNFGPRNPNDPCCKQLNIFKIENVPTESKKKAGF